MRARRAVSLRMLSMYDAIAAWQTGSAAAVSFTMKAPSCCLIMCLCVVVGIVADQAQCPKPIASVIGEERTHATGSP